MKNKVRLSVFALVLIAGMFLAACGPLPAGAEVQVNADGKSAQVEFAGTVDSIAADQWVVAGQTLAITPQTVLDATILAGDMVKVHATVTADGKVTADSIEPYTPAASSTPGASPTPGASSTPDASPTPGASSTPEAGSGTSTHAGHLELVGKVESISPDSWTISGLVFGIGTKTGVKGIIVVGDMVKVEAFINADGTITATEIHLYNGNSSGAASGTLELTGTVGSIAPDQWTISGLNFTIDPKTKINGTINVGDMAQVEALFSNGAFTAREIHLAEGTSTSSDPTSTPDAGVEMEFTGVVESIGPDSWTVGGQTFAINSKTEIKNAVVVGDTVRVEAFGNLDGALTAHEIKKVESPASSTPDAGSDDHRSNPGSATPSDDSEDHESKP